MNLLRILGAAAAALFAVTPAAAERFSFMALGDTAYNLPRDLPVYESLIARINAAKPAFTIHVGDTWGAMPCTEENHRWVLGYFQKYDHPLVYTPGDNEWTDCRKPEILEAYRAVMGGEATPEQRRVLGSARQLDNAFAGTSFADTLASRDAIRRVFFAAPQSLGAQPMPLVRQADVSPFKDMVENARWERDGVVFATVHVPGSGANFTINDEKKALDAIARNTANVAWIKDVFAEAEARQAKAVVVAIHAGMFVEGEGGEFFGSALRGDQEGPYFWVALALRDMAAKFGKPVLLINGDFHELVIDRPFLVSQGESRPPLYGNITRLQVYGAPELKAVQVNVDTATPWVFSFQPLHD